MSLTPRRAAFVREYLKDFNAKQAALRAGYSPHTADRQGSRLLTFVGVQQAIAEGHAHLAEKSEMDAAEWRRRVAALARFDIRKLFDPETNKLLPINELPDDVAPCVTGVKVLREKTTRTRVDAETEEDTDETLIEVKSADVLRALEMVGKHLGELKDTATLNVPALSQLVDRLTAGRKRLRG